VYLPEAVPLPWKLWRVCETVGLRSAPWARARECVSVSPGAARLRLLAMGDLAFTPAAARDAEGAFGDLLPLLREADLRTGNLEAPLTALTQPAGCVGSFLRSEPETLRILAEAGFDVLNVANNHAFDFGQAGLADTLDLLRSGGIDACGSGGDAERPQAPVVRAARGLRVGFLGFCDDHFPAPAAHAGPRPALAAENQLLAAVEAATASVDVLVVHLHWGYEFCLHPLLSHRNLARRVVERGARLVICHHAHVPLGCEVWRGGLIAYGLGNAVVARSEYMREGHPWTNRSFLLDVTLAENGVCGYRLHAFSIGADGRLRLLSGGPRRDLLAGLARASQRLGDERFLERLERCRMVFEALLLLRSLRRAAERGPQALLERARGLGLVRQRRLIDWLASDEELRGCSGFFASLAASATDEPALRRSYEAGAPAASERLLLSRYRWRDALRARLP
jgi:poly-gamma-glutamate synthesis protein (capsule biosynthesis protein)